MAKTSLGKANFPPLAPRAQLRWHVVRPLLQRIAPDTTLEVGTGQGAMSARIAAMTAKSYIGFELDELSYDRARSRVEQFGGVVRNQTLSCVAPQPAQLLCAFEVLEHIEDDAAALREWSEFLSPGGHLLLSVPADPDRFAPMDRQAGHFRRYAPRGLQTLVESVGLIDAAPILYGAPLGYGLEAVRNRLSSRALADTRGSQPELAALTAASGRTGQFDGSSWKSKVVMAATFPFTYLQDVWPGGVGLVLSARKPLLA